MKGIIFILELLFLLSVVGLIASSIGWEVLQEWKLTLIITAGALFIITAILRKQRKAST
ncbi:hypothetical protein [Halobacillus sp. A5]|uniref:hypothetical protein n=1 Tax=Halobacillus sp. A5 TaxID=2880263 RepID=UPI0020A65282|nr:hypothetical protein [Halobacillus sp. A5]MCP3029628.1 hypothetical protein [Halobacillus sp. A5]